MIESAIEHALYWDLERMLKKRILNRTLDQEHALCLLGFNDAENIEVIFKNFVLMNCLILLPNGLNCSI